MDSTAFPLCFDYVALGHIHRPQKIGGNEYIRYSGSPVALSFSEKEDKKCVIIIETEKGKSNKPKILHLPKYRELKKFSGNLETVKSNLNEYDPDFPLISFVEIEVTENEFSSVILAEIEELKLSFTENEKFKILKGKTIFKSGTKDTSDLFKEGENIEDLTPVEVFTKILESEELDEEKEKELQEAFLELLEIVEQSDEA